MVRGWSARRWSARAIKYWTRRAPAKQEKICQNYKGNIDLMITDVVMPD